MSSRDDPGPPRELLQAALEAVLFAAGEPVKAAEVADAFGLSDETPVVEAFEHLSAEYESRPGGLVLERVAGGFRIATRSNVGAWVRQFFKQRNRARLTPAGLETLAIVAYRQPVTAPEVQAIRGVDPSGTLRSLLEKRMIRILGKKKVVGSPFLYGTTRDFLVHFGLDTLDELPSLEEFEEVLGGLAGINEDVAPAGDIVEESPREEASEEVDDTTSREGADRP
jgi:segregation and condensation protein B